MAEEKVTGTVDRWHDESPPIRPDGLQLDENRVFQERFWIAERGAWLFFVAFVLMALFGLTGSGGAFSSTARLAGEAKVEYPAVTRWKTSDRMTITFVRPAAGHNVAFSAAFAEAFQMEGVQPEPIETAFSDGGQILAFSADDHRGTVTIDLRARSPGRKSFEITVDGGSPVQLSTFVLP